MKIFLFYRTHTGYKPLTYHSCNRAFGDPSNLNKHVRLHAGTNRETPYRCNLCNKVFVRRRDMGRHIKSRHHGEYASLSEKSSQWHSKLKMGEMLNESPLAPGKDYARRWLPFGPTTCQMYGRILNIYVFPSFLSSFSRFLLQEIFFLYFRVQKYLTTRKWKMVKSIAVGCDSGYKRKLSIGWACDNKNCVI